MGIQGTRPEVQAWDHQLGGQLHKARVVADSTMNATVNLAMIAITNVNATAAEECIGSPNVVEKGRENSINRREAMPVKVARVLPFLELYPDKWTAQLLQLVFIGI